MTSISGKREISRDSFQYSLDGYKYLEDLRYLTKYFVLLKNKKIISTSLITERIGIIYALHMVS